MPEHQNCMLWLMQWCVDNDLELQTDGEVGFGRECVGILDPDLQCFVDYDVYDGDPYDIDKELVRRPDADKLGPGDDAPDAYHKHDCLAVLGRGRYAEEQLYKWVRRLVDQGAIIERGLPRSGRDVASLMGKTTRTRITIPSSG